MSTYALRTKLIEIAKRDVGQIEKTRNRGLAMAKYWPATSTPELYTNMKAAPYYGRPPYCAAAVAYWVREWLKDPEVLTALGTTPSQAEKWRCKSPGAFAWQDWAERKGLLVMNDSQKHTLHCGDIMVFDMSHIGIVETDNKDMVFTVEANTGASGSRDGDGIWTKARQRSLAKCFIRLMA